MEKREAVQFNAASAGKGCDALQFTKESCTLKKLIPIIAYRFYATETISYSKKSEKAKRFIKNLLCSDCSQKHINNCTNDYYTLDSALCVNCGNRIIQRIDAAIALGESPWFQNLMKRLRYKREAIRYELELRHKKPFYTIMKDWYVTRRMSSIEIQQLLQNQYRFRISSREITRWLNELGLMRSFVQAMRNRVVTGRMDYSQREISLRTRKTKRQSKDFNRQPLRRSIYIEIPMSLKIEIAQIAKQSKRTVSEVVRDMLAIAKKHGNSGDQSKAEQLMFALEHYRELLLKRRMKRKRAELIHLAVK